MRKLALAAAVGAAALFISVDAQAAPVSVDHSGSTAAKASVLTDVSARRYRVYRHYGWRRPVYRSYAYAPAPYYYGGPAYYGYGGPSVSFSFGGGGFRHGWHRW